MAKPDNIAAFMRMNGISNDETQRNQHWHGGTGNNKNPIGWLMDQEPAGPPSPPPQEENVMEIFKRGSQVGFGGTAQPQTQPQPQPQPQPPMRAVKRVNSFGQAATPPQVSPPATRWGSTVPTFQPIREPATKPQPPPPTPPQDITDIPPPPPPPIDSPPPPPPLPPPPPEDPPVSPQPVVVIPPPIVAPIPPVEPASPSALTLGEGRLAVHKMQVARVEQLPVREGSAVITSTGVKGVVDEVSISTCVIKSCDGYWLERPLSDVRSVLLVVINAPHGGFLAASPPLLPYLSTNFYVVSIGNSILPPSGSTTTIPPSTSDPLEDAWATNPAWDATNTLLLQDSCNTDHPSNTLIVPPRLGPKRDAENSKTLQKMLERLVASETDVRAFVEDVVTGEWATGKWKVPVSVPAYAEPVKVVQKAESCPQGTVESVVPSKAAIQSILSQVGLFFRKKPDKRTDKTREKREKKKVLVAAAAVPHMHSAQYSKSEIVSWVGCDEDISKENRDWWPKDDESLVNRPGPPPTAVTAASAASPGRGGKPFGGRKSQARRGRGRT